MSSSEEEFMGDEDESDDEEFVGESEDDDKPLSSLKARASRPKASMKEDSGDDDEEDSDDDDDDIPLAALKSPVKTKTKAKQKPAAKKTAPPKKRASTKAKAAKPKKKTKATSTTTTATNNSSSFASASAALYGSKSIKGEVIQELLCRWWYAMEWPSNPGQEPPKHYDALNGMPGVFVCTSGSNVGHLMDTRDKTTCPNFVNFANKPCAELQQLLIQAIKAQREALVQAEGQGTETESKLKSKLKWAEKINPEKADKQAVKVLKAAKLTLPSLPKE